VCIKAPNLPICIQGGNRDGIIPDVRIGGIEVDL
jgi:hypothetical protein